MSLAKPCPTKDQSQLSLEWDQMADERHRQIASGKDISFDHVLIPLITDLLDGADMSLLIDIGSGTGDLTARLSLNAKRIIGIEPSRASVLIAREICSDTSKVQFIHSALENAQKFFTRERATSACACMTLMTAPGLLNFANSLSNYLEVGAVFAATITHPFFWPSYWEYDTEPWFNYSKETYLTAPFTTSNCQTTIMTTHIHRPLGMYLDVFSRAGFVLESLVEPIPPQKIQSLYPEPWLFPRFLGLRWVKSTNIEPTE